MTNEMMKLTWNKVVGAFNKSELCDNGLRVLGRLYSCTAFIYSVVVDNKRYVVLKSYKTVVAIWDTEEGIVIDALREVYGYTNTSAQHIAKFQKWIKRQFGATPCVYRVLTWDDIKRIK